MFPYENILIPIDGSAGTTRAVQHGLALAESLEATVHVLSVVDDASLDLDIRSTISEQDHEQAATEAVEKSSPKRRHLASPTQPNISNMEILRM